MQNNQKKLVFEEFRSLWDKSNGQPVKILDTDSFDLIIHQTKIDSDIRICRISLKKREFKHLKPYLLENLTLTIENKSIFSLVVSNADFFEVFNHLIFSLYMDLFSDNDGKKIEAVLIDLFQKYFALFAKKRKNQINKVVGLYGELLALKYIVKDKGSHNIRNWNGPEGNRHDFSFNKKSLEVKSVYKNYDNIAISNEYQLYINPPEELYLKVYFFDVKQNSSHDSVRKLIRDIIDLCENSDDKLIFISKINETGISFSENFSLKPELKIDLLEESSYHVTENFPKITKTMIPEGVSHLKYSVQLSSIPEELKINNEKIWKQIL